MSSEKNDTYTQENHRSTDTTRKPSERKVILENFSFLREVIRFDEENGEIQAAEADWIIIRADLLREMFEGFRAFLGRDADAAIRAAGKNSGKRFVDILLARGLQLEEADIILNMLLNQGGWGKVEMQIDRDVHKAVITIRNCAIARGVKSTQPSCYFLAGYFEGFYEKLFKTEMECVESNCMATGGSLCEFEEKPKKVK